MFKPNKADHVPFLYGSLQYDIHQQATVSCICHPHKPSSLYHLQYEKSLHFTQSTYQIKSRGFEKKKNQLQQIVVAI